MACPWAPRCGLVDFDKCNHVQVWDDTLARDIKKLALGICANDPYYPSPLPDTQLGWDVYLTFTETYIQAGRQIIERGLSKGASSDEVLERVLKRPAMVMTEWTKIVADAKENNEREVYDLRKKIRQKLEWKTPSWFMK